MYIFLAPFLVGVASSAFFSLLSILLFDPEKIKAWLYSRLNIKFYKSFDKVRSRKQLIHLFNQIFVSYKVKSGGKIFLMSHTGGYPEYDPYIRIIELSTYGSIDIYLAVSLSSMKAYYIKQPENTNKLIQSPNIRLYVFDNLIPYQFRIGVNTDMGLGFFCAYYGHNYNKVDLEGIVSSNPLMIEAFENLYLGLLHKATEITGNNSSLLQ